MCSRLIATLFALMLAGPALAADPPKTTPTKPDEPMAKAFSPSRAADYLDSVGLGWTRERKCITCHTNAFYVVSRPLLGGDQAAVKEVRSFLEDRAAKWDMNKPRWDTEVLATAAVLALNDAHTTGKLHPLTRQALDRMWPLQKPNGAWNWLKCAWPPMEHDDYYGATLVAVGVGHAPDGYAKGESAQAGLAKLREYFKKTPAPDLHHRAMLLWASAKLGGLLSADEQKAVVRELRERQHDDGGWGLPSLGKYKRRDGTPNDANAPSDGYATGLVVLALREAGVPASDPAIQKGVKWLKANQRESGRWFTRSLNNDKAHYITNAGTAFAVLALHAAGVELKGATK